AQAVEFTLRRLGEAAVGFMVAIRPGAASSFDVSRMDLVALNGLDRPAARQLLARTGRPIAPPVAGRRADGVGGHPLALLELAAMLPEGQLNGLDPLSEPLPVAEALRRTSALCLDALAPGTRRLLLLAAADAPTSLAVLRHASELLRL